ncbi:MAG: hypothetical protein IJJ71_14025 [Treponema sp.]|uniref:hypothetical protein n=1 Tax=Treponema sp. TaxID=166 RepID=UPI0025E65206|nr:hypothetical protein [Treponema sp.]MBQ9624038.1 hypothetical protein [Treponema sp.]MBR0101402.1 hypothetical protein [Treponema sp.]MBR0497277.1 hypothetical protein [Treponema sp.]
MDEIKLKSTLSAHSIPDGFIKVTDKPIQGLTSEQKAVLNRKGNVLFNEGKYDAACRIFVTTGYSDGLARIGDLYMKQNKGLTALKYYLLANNRAKSEAVYEKIASIISVIIK